MMSKVAVRSMLYAIVTSIAFPCFAAELRMWKRYVDDDSDDTARRGSASCINT